MKLTTWNVNGIRAAMDKGLRAYIQDCDADIICLQEIKALPEQVDLAWLSGYHTLWNSAEKKGYSGTCILAREAPRTSSFGMDMDEPDREGRMITAEFEHFFLVNVYTPNAKAELLRLPYRLAWDDAFRRHLKKLEEKKPVLVCGDLNCAHQEIDIANPKANRFNPGFSDAERASFTRHLEAGFIDVFRAFDKSPGRYTWWTMRTRGNARLQNIGWRLDYWLASESLRTAFQSCTIRADVFGSDHCPVETVIA